MSDPEVHGSELIVEVEEMIARLEELGDAGDARAGVGPLGRLEFFSGRPASPRRCYERSIELRRARRAARTSRTRLGMWWAGAKRHGAASVEEASAFLEELAQVTERSTGHEAYRLALRAGCSR